MRAARVLVPPASSARNIRNRCHFGIAGLGLVQYCKRNFQPSAGEEKPILTSTRAAITSEHAPGVASRIQALLPEMPAAIARVAEYILKNPQAPLTLSIGDLAEEAGTAAATVTRFCRMIGYAGYV